MYTICQNLKSIEVKYGASYSYPTKSFIPIFTSSNDTILKSIYMSSPKLRLAWNKTFSNDEKSFNIEFVGDSNKFIERLKEFCAKVVKKKCKSDHEIDLNQIKSYTNDAHALRFYNVNISDISSYDEDGHKISIYDIVRDDQVKILFHLHGIAFKGMKVQFEMKLIQIMKVLPYAQVNQTMNLLTNPKPFQSHSIKSIPMPPPPPPPSMKNVPQHKPKPKQPTKPVALSALSVISQEELLKAMSKLKKRE